MRLYVFSVVVSVAAAVIGEGLIDVAWTMFYDAVITRGGGGGGNGPKTEVIGEGSGGYPETVVSVELKPFVPAVTTLCAKSLKLWVVGNVRFVDFGRNGLLLQLPQRQSSNSSTTAFAMGG